MAEVAAHKGARVRFLDTQQNREKGVAGGTGTIKKVQDWVLHVKMDEPQQGSVLPSGMQYPTRTQVEVIEGE